MLKENELLLLSFLTVEDYLVRLRWLCLLLSGQRTDGLHATQGLLIYLASAVSDFYIPSTQLPRHKLHAGQFSQSDTNSAIESGSDGSLTIRLSPVPKVLRLLSSSWAKSAMVVSFKVSGTFLIFTLRGPFPPGWPFIVVLILSYWLAILKQEQI